MTKLKPNRPESNSHDFLDDLCRKQVELDNQLFGTESVYLPNPVFSMAAKYFLISSEPSIGNTTAENFRVQVEKGFKNFLKYEGDLILHYCAFRFLCGDSFDYKLTDISKGAMPTDVAKKNRNDRFMHWMPILQEEIRYLGASALISVGNNARDFLIKNGFDVPFHVRHFAKNCDDYFSGYYAYYQRHSDQILTNDLLEKLWSFLNLIADALPEGCPNIPILRRIFDNHDDISDAGKGRFLYYKDEFSAILGNSV